VVKEHHVRRDEDRDKDLKHPPEAWAGPLYDVRVV
jgi:hypothetical protein